MTALAVSVRPRPFCGVAVPMTFDGDGLTVADIVAQALVDPEFRGSLLVRVNGHEIDRQYWHRARIFAVSRSGAPVLVTIDPLPEGGDFKQVLMIAGAIAISIGTAWIGAGGLAVALGTTGGLFGAGTTSAAIAAAAFGFAGSLALAALAPPPITPNSRRTPQPKQLAGVSANAPAVLEQLPTVRGKMRVSPPLIVPPYTALVKGGDTKTFAVVGLAGFHLIENIYVNGAKIEDLEGIEYNTREGWDDDDPLELVTKTVIEERPASKMDEFDLKRGSSTLSHLEDQSTPQNSVPQWHNFVTRGIADHAIFRLHWPQGITETSGVGLDHAGVPIRIRIRERGSSTWLKLPELHFYNQSGQIREKRQHISLLWETGAGSYADNDDINAYVAFWKAAPGQAWEWAAESYFDPGGGSIKPAHVTNGKLGWTVYLDQGTFPRGIYEISIRRGLAYQHADFSKTLYEYQTSTDKANFFSYYDDGGTQKVRITQEQFSATTMLEAFQTVRDDYPILQPNLTLIELSAINQQINSISAAFTSYAPIIDAGAWDTDYSPTRNPAALLRDVWLGTLNADAKPTTTVDHDNLEDFYNDCAGKDYFCDFIVEAGQSVGSVAQIIASTGYAAIAAFEKWGVVMDRDRSADPITQLYTPLNTKNFRVERGFADVPHGLKVEFIDRDDDYKLKEIIVYRDGYDAGNATLFEGIRYPGFASELAAIQRATRDLNQIVMRDISYVFETGIEHLRTPQGGLCGLTHDVVAAPMFFSYVKSFTVDGGGDITSITCEAEIDFAAIGGDVGATLRLRNGTMVTRGVTETTASKTATFVTAFDANGNLEVDCLVGFGPLSAETRRVIVFEIEPLADDRARLICRDEAPGVYAAWPLHKALIDLDFVNERYIWGGFERETAEFTTWALNGSTFGANGLTPSSTVDITLDVTEFAYAAPFTMVAALRPTSTPGSNRVPVSLHDTTGDEAVRFRHTSGVNFEINVVDGGSSVATVTHAATNDAKNVFAASIQTNAIRGAWNGEALTEDTSATLPTVTLLQIGKRETASSEFTGPIARVIILPGASTQDELNALSALLLN